MSKRKYIRGVLARNLEDSAIEEGIRLTSILLATMHESAPYRMTRAAIRSAILETAEAAVRQTMIVRGVVETGRTDFTQVHWPDLPRGFRLALEEHVNRLPSSFLPDRFLTIVRTTLEREFRDECSLFPGNN